MALCYSVESKSRNLHLLVLVVLSYKEMISVLGQSKEDYLFFFVHTDRQIHRHTDMHTHYTHHTHDLNQIFCVLFHFNHYFTSIFSSYRLEAVKLA